MSESEIERTLREQAEAATKKTEPEKAAPAPAAAPTAKAAPEFKMELSEDAQEKLRKEAFELVQKEIAAAKKKEFLDAEVARLRLEAGLSGPGRGPGGVQGELVTFTMDLEYEGSSHVQIEMPAGRCYFHGMQYTVPRHVYNVLMETMQANRRLQASTEGKSVWRSVSKGAKISAKTLGQVQAPSIASEALH